MTEIVASINRVTDIMAEITSASVQQSSGIEQVNTAIVQMDQVTQQNAALVEPAGLGRHRRCMHVVPAQAGTHAELAQERAYRFPPAREVISPNGGNDDGGG